MRRSGEFVATTTANRPRRLRYAVWFLIAVLAYAQPSLEQRARALRMWEMQAEQIRKDALFTERERRVAAAEVEADMRTRVQRVLDAAAKYQAQPAGTVNARTEKELWKAVESLRAIRPRK